MAVVIIKAAKEEVIRRSLKREKSVQRGGHGWKIGQSKHMTFIQETAVSVQCETRSQCRVVLTY